MKEAKPVQTEEDKLAELLINMNRDVTVDLASESDEVYTESDTEIFRRGKDGELILKQPEPPVTNEFLGKETEIIFTFKNAPDVKQITGRIEKVNTRFILIKLIGFVRNAQDRRDNMRLNVAADQNIHFNVFQKKTGDHLPGVKAVNISNTGARFGFKKCPDCDNRKTCIHKLKKNEEIRIEMIFADTNQKLSFDAVVKSFRFNSPTEFIAGIHFSTTRRMNDVMAKIVRYYEKKMIKVKSRDKDKLVKKIRTRI